MAASDRNANEARVGTVLAGKYKLTRVLGSGGMGAVYEAVNTWTERKVAIKVMLGELATDADFVARFMREARAATRVAHPNIVDVLDMGNDGDVGAIFIVQELLSGGDFAALLDKRGALAPREAIEIVAPVMSALVAAHRRGVVHRDLKPENVFLARGGAGPVPKLIDFGIAKYSSGGEGSKTITRTGAAMGTPVYMSPEQARGEKDVDAQTDVWAMGVVLFEALAARTPWTGENYNQLIFEIVSGPIERLDKVKLSVPKSLADVVHRAIERERSKRFATMQAFLEALLDCEGLEPGDWRDKLRAAHEAAMRVGTSSPPPADRTDEETSAPTEPAVNTAPGIGIGDSVPPLVGKSDDTTAKRSRTTFGQTARELEARPHAPRRTTIAIATITVLAAGGTLMAWRLANRSRDATTPTRRSTLASPTTPTPIRPVETFAAMVTVHPSTAILEIDGEATGVNSLARTFPRDGRHHILRATAPGYEPFAIEFQDLPPPPTIELQMIAPAADAAPLEPAPAPVRHAQHTSTPAAPHARPTPTHAHPVTQFGANGTPLLGGEE